MVQLDLPIFGLISPSAPRLAGWRAVIGFAALVMTLSGCALSRPPSHGEIIEHALPKGTAIPPAWSSTPGSDSVTDDWLKSFNDPGLDAVVAEAIANNRDLLQAAARVEVARQTVVVLGAKLKPQVNAVFGASTTRDADQNEAYNSDIAYAAISWEIDLWGHLRAQRSAAEAGYEATADEYAFARQSLAATTARSWYLAIATHRMLVLAEQGVRIYSQLLDLVKVRRAAGKVADLDVAEAGANLSAAESALRTAQGQYSEARRTLELLLGRYPSAELAVSETFATLPPPVSAGLPSALLERRPDIIAAERQVLAAFRTEEAAKLALLPSFALTVEGGRLSDKLLSVLRLNPWLFHGGLGAFVPIYQGGFLHAQIEIASAQQVQATARYGSVALRAFFEVEVGLTNESILSQRFQIEERGLEDRTEAVRIATVKYVAGSIDMLSVLQLQERQLDSQALVIQLRNALLANRINLHLALGGSFDAAPAASTGSEKIGEETK